MAEERGETQIIQGAEAEATRGATPTPGPPPAAPIGSDRAPLAATAQPSTPPRDAFAPPSTRRRGLAASRGTLPTVIVFSVIAADAAALIIYFIAR